MSNQIYRNTKQRYNYLQNPVENKGDIHVGTGNPIPENLPVGLDGQVLMSDSTQQLGLKWTVGNSTGTLNYGFGLTNHTPDPVDGFDLTKFLVSGNSGGQGYLVEDIWVQLGGNIITNAVSVGYAEAATPTQNNSLGGATNCTYTLPLSSGVTLDTDTGVFTFGDGIWVIEVNAILQRLSGTGDRIHQIAMGFNGFEPSSGLGGETKQGQRFMDLTNTCVYSATLGTNTLAIWYNQIHPGGTGVNDFRIAIQVSMFKLSGMGAFDQSLNIGDNVEFNSLKLATTGGVKGIYDYYEDYTDALFAWTGIWAVDQVSSIRIIRSGKVCSMTISGFSAVSTISANISSVLNIPVRFRPTSVARYRVIVENNSLATAGQMLITAVGNISFGVSGAGVPFSGGGTEGIDSFQINVSYNTA